MQMSLYFIEQEKLRFGSTAYPVPPVQSHPPSATTTVMAASISSQFVFLLSVLPSLASRRGEGERRQFKRQPKVLYSFFIFVPCFNYWLTFSRNSANIFHRNQEEDNEWSARKCYILLKNSQTQKGFLQTCQENVE
jgi:hypothetical protein